jgi:hypothetical protein
MRNKRLQAIILLAVLALLQVRVAFAACDFGPRGAMDSAAAVSCGDHEAPGHSVPVADEVAISCTPSMCLKMYAAQGDDAPLLGSASLSFAHTPPPLSVTAHSDAVRVRASTTPAHPAHTRLIYVLQRLLI